MRAHDIYLPRTARSSLKRAASCGLVTLGLLLVSLLTASGALASSGFSFCPFGSGAGQCENPRGLAVDDSNGRVYVADRGNNRIDVFEPNGDFVNAFGWGVRDGASELQSCTTATGCRRGIAGAGLGQLDRPQSIAIDNDVASPAHQDVYVVDHNRRVQRFDPTGGSPLLFGVTLKREEGDNPIAVGPGGTLYLADSEYLETLAPSGEGQITVWVVTVKRFDPSGTPMGESALPKGGLPQSLAVDSGGDFYVARYLTDSGGITGRGIYKYEASEPEATLLDEIPGDGNVTALAVDPADDHLLAAQLEAGTRVISEWDAAGTALRRFGYGQIEFSPDGLAAAAAGDGVFASEPYEGLETIGNKVLFIPFPPPGPLACCLQASKGSTWARVEGAVNPESKATTYHVEYVDDAAFQGSGFATAKRMPVNPGEDPTLPADLSLHKVGPIQIGCTAPTPQKVAEGKCLTPETLYHYRLVASNADGESKPEGTFETRPPLQITATFAAEVGTDAAELHAVVNPFGTPASGYFEYVSEAAYLEDLGAGGDGFASASRKPDVSGGQAPLDFGAGEEDTAAFVQLGSLAPGTTYRYRLVASDFFRTEAGPVHAFATFPPPAGPENACPNAGFRNGPSASLPDCRAYEMVSPADKNGGDIAVNYNLLSFPAGLDQGSEDGNSIAYSASTAFGGAVSAPYTSQYIARREAGSGWSTQPISPPRDSSEFIGNPGAKVDVDYKAFAADLSSGWLLQHAEPRLDSCAPAGFSGLYRRGVDGSYEALTTAKPAAPQNASGYVPFFQGASADGRVAVFSANGRLNKEASAAIAGPGEPIYQLYEHTAGEGCGQLRLVSVLPGGSASALTSSAGTRAAGFPSGREGRTAGAVSRDGSRIYWQTQTQAGNGGPGPLYVRIDGTETVLVSAENAQFWSAAADGSRAFYSVGKQLYQFDLASKASTLIAGEAPGVVAISADASQVYFVSREALAGEGQAGAPNLYLREAASGETHLVATLAAADLSQGDFRFSGFAVVGAKPIEDGVRLTPDGRHLAFVSSAPLTGYDNADAADGRPDIELYLYDVDTDVLRCVSCNPTDARPAGRRFDGSNGAVRKVSAQMAPAENELYAPRALSADGSRLFFESFEALLPADVNGAMDVYEWERAADAAQCSAIGAGLYVPSAGGCLSLISSGHSPSDSSFVDASPDGHDVFIKTGESLLPQDPGLIDIYDVRVDGGLPARSPLRPSCEGEACQSPSGAPNDPTPASASGEYRGNVHERTGLHRCAKGRRRVRRHGKVRCLKPHHKQKHRRHRHHRANHHRRAGR
jgi:DNA-binding beta-propeller fold protein YncE